MTPDPLTEVIARLCSGDEAAAEQVFRAYEPYLRQVVRRRLPARLRTRFDSEDVVQSMWVDLLGGFRDGAWQFPDAARLRAFLVKVACNRLIDRARRHCRAAERERPLAGDVLDQLPPARQPHPSELAQANDLWEQMLAACPPAHREVLTLRHDGLSPAEIAARTGLHPDSVRRILRDAVRDAARRAGGGPKNS
jgi:RNA polymerase sigma-70 factor (ECF subfamily)